MRGIFDLRAYRRRMSSLQNMNGRLAPRSSTRQTEIGDLAFQCPTTLQHIESGIGMDDFTFQRNERLNVLVHCSACRECHVFKVANGRLMPLGPNRIIARLNMRTNRTIPIVSSSILLVVLMAAFLTGASHAGDGEAAFKARCGECHGPREIAYWGQQRPDTDARQVWLDQFLRRHYPPPDAERMAIVNYIQSTIAMQRTPR